jgi:uncharacterized protein
MTGNLLFSLCTSLMNETKQQPKGKELIVICVVQSMITLLCEILLFILISSTIAPVVLVSRLPDDFIRMSETERTELNTVMVQSLTEELKDEDKKKDINLEYTQALIQSPSILLMNSVLWAVAFLIPGYYFFIKKMNYPLPDLGKDFDLNVISKGLYLGFVIFLWVGMLSIIMHWIGYKPPIPEFQKMLFTSLKDNFYLLGFGIYVIGIVTGIIEEYFFRGYLLTYFQTIGQDSLGLIFTSVLFGILHYSPEVSFVNPFFITMVGYMLGLAYLRTGNLWISIFGHATYNSLGLIAAFLLGDKLL